MVYIDEATFELAYPHRDASVDPGSSEFTQWIKEYSAEINIYLGVDSDICAFGDDTDESNFMAKQIGILLEARIDYKLTRKRTSSFDLVAMSPEPSLFDDRFWRVRMALSSILGTLGAEAESAWTYEFTRYSGGNVL